jgi:tetratricopeptide (TPR) repeat protein
MAFVESQQDNYWKRDPHFDRRDVTVITQNALCDTYYSHYIRNQYDARFRPGPKDWTPFERWLGRDKAYPEVPVTCVSNDELLACWAEYQTWPDVAARLQAGGPIIRGGSNDVYDINGIVARKIFEANKKDHTFYIEQSIPLQWMYPYLLPWHLIFKLSPEPVADLPASVIEEDRKFWDDYSARLLNDPRFSIDADAILTFGKLAFWHSDLYRWRKLPKEQEYWLRMSIRLCPQLEDSVNSLAHLLADQKRYDEAVALLKQAELDDPRNDFYPPILTWLQEAQVFDKREKELRDELAKSPYDVQLNLDLARLYQDEEKYPELNDRLRMVAGLTNWSHDGMADIVQYYVNTVHNPDAAIAFLEARAKIDPKASELIYSLAALDASSDHKEDALKYLGQAVALGGTNAVISAKIDPRFASLHDDPRFQTLLDTKPLQTNAPGTNAPGTNSPATNTPATNAPATNAPATNSSVTNLPAIKAPSVIPPFAPQKQP